jgi:polyisoprenoid-binding protein YceI
MKLAALVLLAGLASAAELRFVPDGRPLKLEVEKAGLLSGKKHLFEFPAYSGALRFDPANPGAASVTIEVLSASFMVMDDWIDQKDRQKVAEFTRSPAMLDVSRHPKLVFRSAAIEPIREDAYRVLGELTIRGIAKPVTLIVKLRREAGGLIVEGRVAFPMTQFGLKPPSAALGAIRTKDVMTLRLEVLAK